MSDTRESQSIKILAALKSGNRLTPIDALREFKCFRLSGRVKELRDAGHNIKSQMIVVGIENTKRVSQYWIDPNDPFIPREKKKKIQKISFDRLRELAKREARDLNEQLLFSRLIIAAERN